MSAGPHRIPGVASTAIQGILESPGTGVVLGSSSHAVWLLVDDSVVVVSTADATRLPNGIEIAVEGQSGPFRSVRHGDAATMGDGAISFSNLTVAVTRWWDPRPALPATTAQGLAEAIGLLPSDVPDLDGSLLRAALAEASVPGLLAAAEGVLGLGTGLTPEGDDYLAGALAALRTLGPALGLTVVESMLDEVAGPLTALAGERTTAFSAALIANALRGEVASPAGALLRAVAGRGDIAGAHAALSRVGHSSGPALAAGIVLGVQSLLHLAGPR